jgi:hypothetical protein
MIFNVSGTFEILRGAQIGSQIFHGTGSGGDIVINAGALIASGVNLDANGNVIAAPFPFPSGIFSI